MPELVPLRYGRMLESPFRFYRGAAAIMAATWRPPRAPGIAAQLCGDAHLLNFRLLASPERHLMFDINDFDETLPGPWEWDVKRLAASLVIAGRDNGFTDRAAAGDRPRPRCASYRERMRRFAGMRNLDVWYAQADVGRPPAERWHQRLNKPRPQAGCPGSWRRRGPATACRRSRSSPGWSTASAGSPPIPR